MMRHPTAMRFVLLLLVIWQATVRSNAAPAAVKTTPHVFPLHFVSWLKGGPTVPEIALKADFVAYPSSPLPKQFLDAPADSPEHFVARYLQVLSDGKGTLTPETLNAAKSFYSPDEGKDKASAIEKLINHDYTRFNRHPDTIMWHRYDAGPLTMISLVYNSPVGLLPVLTCNLRKGGSSYFLTTYQSIFGDERGNPLFVVFVENESNLARRPNLADAPQPKYQYGFPLRSSVPGDTSAPNSLKIVFNGTPSDVLVDEKMVPADATQAFVKRAILTERHGNLQQFLALWTDYDVKGIFARRLAMQPGEIPTSSLGLVSSIGQSRIVFTIDGGVESLVFLRTSYSKELRMLVVWKQAPDAYRLSESGDLETNQITLPGEMRVLFDSSAFQNYLNAQVDQFIKEKGAAGAASQRSPQ